jgi:hypothetical protein
MNHLKIVEAVGSPINDFPMCLTIVMCCAIHSTYDNEVGWYCNLFHKYLGTSVLLVYVFYSFCLIIFYC